jgi:hypothetical protein
MRYPLMWMTRFETHTTATPEQIWKIWSDVANWRTWDPEVESSRIDGAFQAGTRGVLKPKGGPSTKFVILEASPQSGFRDRSFLPLTHLDFNHEVRAEGGKTIVVHQAEMRGLLAPLFSRIIGRKIEKGMPEAVARLVRLAEGGK